jgi:hypothetical protein
MKLKSEPNWEDFDFQTKGRPAVFETEKPKTPGKPPKPSLKDTLKDVLGSDNK